MTELRWLSAFLVLAALALPGCKAAERKQAAEAYRKALREHEHRFTRFNTEYPQVELRLKGPRHADPTAVVRIIRQQMLPLLAQTIAGFDPLVEKGRAYVALLADSVAAKPKLKRAVEDFARQKQAMLKIRQTYVDEAALFTKGKPAPEALRKILQARIAAARKLQQAGQ